MARQSTTQRPHSRSRTDGSIIADCARTCNETLSYCLEQGGEHVAAEHLKSMIDCIDVCTTTARLDERESPLHKQAMELCAEACKACEESCEQFEGDVRMTECANVCRQCYEHCAA